jgi:hypothetical protein
VSDRQSIAEAVVREDGGPAASRSPVPATIAASGGCKARIAASERRRSCSMSRVLDSANAGRLGHDNPLVYCRLRPVRPLIPFRETRLCNNPPKLA